MSECIFKKFKQINCGSLFPNLPWAAAPGGCLSLQGLCYKESHRICVCGLSLRQRC